MKKIIISIFFLFFFNKLFAADYNNLPTIQKTLFSTEEVHLSCFNNENKFLGMLNYSGEYKVVQFSGWKLENNAINIEPSSTNSLIKFPVPLKKLELIVLNLKDFSMKISQYDIDLNDPSPDPKLLKAIKNKTLFDYMKVEKPTKVEKIQCGVTWAFKIRPIKDNDEIREKIINEAIKESKKKKCAGDPLKWDNCVGYTENRDFHYLGEFRDGWMSGQGIEIKSFGNFYIGNFFEDYKEGNGTQFYSALYEYVSDYEQGNTAWLLKGMWKEGEWSELNTLQNYEAIKKFSY